MTITNDYPFVKCLSPKVVFNKYTKERLTVPCGCCKACLTASANRYSLLCKIEETQHKYCMFVTLTYSNENLPLLDYGTLSCSDYKLYVGNKDDVEFTLPKESLPLLAAISKKQNLSYNSQIQGGIIATLYKKHIQQFNKRLRKNIQPYTDEKIRFFAVGEYGPIHLRPHYHVLYFFDKQETLSAIIKVLYSSWSFGRVDFSLSRGQCNSYVAKYVNSNYSLPSVFSNVALRPFSLHSVFFATDAYKREKKTIDALPVRDLVVFKLPLNGKFCSVPSWRSFKSLFFPKTYGFRVATDEQLIYAYRSILYARKEFGQTCSVKTLANEILYYCRNYTKFNPASVPSIVKYFYSFCNGNYKENTTTYEYFSRVYLILLISNHFINFCCNGNTDYFVSQQYIKRIKDFYSCCELSSLKRFYSLQQECSKYAFEDYFLFYSNFFEWSKPSICKDFLRVLDENFHADGKFLSILKHPQSWFFNRLFNSPVYKGFRSDINVKYERTIKHKKLNDSNYMYFKMFDYE